MNTHESTTTTHGSSSMTKTAEKRLSGSRKGVLLALAALACVSCATPHCTTPPSDPASSDPAPPSFTYEHVIGTGEDTPKDPNYVPVDTGDTIEACDIGSLTDSGVMASVCSFDGDKNSDGGVYIPNNGDPVRSFRREVPLPGQPVGFENAVIPFGFPALHPTTGDTYITVFFSLDPDEDPNEPGASQKGIYTYGRESLETVAIAATTGTPTSPPGIAGTWTDFSTNVAVSEKGAFFVGDYRLDSGGKGQGIFHYPDDGNLRELIGLPESTPIPGRSTVFSAYRAVAAHADGVVFVGESADCTSGDAGCFRGVYHLRFGAGTLETVIESGANVPEGGTFLDFAVEPESGIFHSSIAVNDRHDIVLVASFEDGGEPMQGVFLLKDSAGYTPTEILRSSDAITEFLDVPIDSFNTVAINSRSELAFTVANRDRLAPAQGLVFYRNSIEGPQRVFKKGDTFLADLVHPGPTYTTHAHGGMVAGSQALDSSSPPRLYFRHAYTMNGDVYSMMVVATLH